MKQYALIAYVMKGVFVLLLLSVCPVITIQAQTAGYTATGKVTDEKGAPLAGVSVTVKGAGTSKITDDQGRFSLEVRSPADSLVFSHTGYQVKTLAALGVKNLTIQLEPATNGLNDVVVVGYGTQKKISVTGAISTVKIADVQTFSTPSLSNAIGGRLPGIITRQSSGEPGFDAANVYIRGFGTFGTGLRTPLILVDGVERDMNNINVQEIESFSILKDASATAVYGVRGANGVVLITTKRGTDAPPKVIFRTENASLTALRLPHYINSYEYGLLANEANANAGITAPFFTPDQLQKYRDHSDPFLYPDVDWVDVVLKKTTFQSINNLSFSGGNKNVRYFTNLGYTVQGGLYKEDPTVPYHTNSNLKRYNFRSNIDVNLTSNLVVSLNLGGIIQNRIMPGTYASDARSNAVEIFNALRWTPNNAYPIKNPDGSIPGKGTFLAENPFAVSTQQGYKTVAVNTIQSSLGVKWDLSKQITPGLSVNGLYAYDYYGLLTNSRYKTPKTFQYLGKDASGADRYVVAQPGSELTYNTVPASNRAYYLQTSVNYDRAFGKHRLGGMLLGNRREYVDLTAGSSVGNIPYRSQGLAARFTYDYDSRYLIESDMGYNGSENFAKNKRYGFFPSISAGWIISHEKFWKSNTITLLKLRGSYGQVGNDQIGGNRFLFLTTINTRADNYLFGASQVNITGAFAESLIGNPDITWERSKKADAAVEMELWNGKLAFQMDVFNERRSNILLQRQRVPISAGYIPSTIPFANLGRLNNRGIEGNLQIRNTTRGGFYYSVQGNFSFAHNKIIEDDSPLKPYAYQNSRGQSVDKNYGYIALGLFKDQADVDKSPAQTALQSVIRPGDIKYKDLNGDGVIDVNDQTWLGYPTTPEIMYGFGGTVAYHGFDMSVFFTGAAHSSLFIGDDRAITAFKDGVGQYNVVREYYDHRWIPGADNANALYPAVLNVRNTNNYVVNSLYLKNGNYLRLKSAEVGYTLPHKLMQRIHIRNIRVFVNGTNLAIWDHIKIVNPESNQGDGAFAYPLQRNINFGAQVNF